MLDPAREALHGVAPQQGFLGLGLGGRKGREEILAEAELEVAAPRQLDRVVQRLGQVGEALGHLGRRLQVLLGRIGARALGIVEDVAGVDRDPGLVRLEVLAREEAHVVGRHRRRVEAAGEVDRGGDVGIGVGVPGAHQFEVPAVAEALAPAPCRGKRGVIAAGQRKVADVGMRAGQHDQPVVGLVQPLTPHDRVLAVALAIGARAAAPTGCGSRCGPGTAGSAGTARQPDRRPRHRSPRSA